MKAVTLAAFLCVSFVVAVRTDVAPQYYVPVPAYEPEVIEEASNGGRQKRSAAALPFLVGVAAGGIFGPILYNRLYGNGWSAPAVQYETYYQPATKGWGGASGGY